ncbi:hypothetical protein [Comamonas sp. BIGb0124]|uniref:hypothetical protein n=1 Tax=Comamonas sp. BIGb0124 TaxID=2485130 RepID=UPI0011CE4E13|nr:hypothetical protein [Comamonas sp. BIGb0124]
MTQIHTSPSNSFFMCGEFDDCPEELFSRSTAPHACKFPLYDEICGTWDQLRALDYSGPKPNDAVRVKVFVSKAGLCDVVRWDPGMELFRWERALRSPDAVQARASEIEAEWGVDDPSKTIAGWFRNSHRTKAAGLLERISTGGLSARQSEALAKRAWLILQGV